jgi:hypothetical protein
VVLYGCETWSLTLREEHRLRVFENRMLRRIYGPKWDEEKAAERGASRFVLFAKYNTNNQVKEDEMDEARSANGREEERV